MTTTQTNAALPANPAALVGKFVWLTQAVRDQVPAFSAFGPACFEVVEFYGVTGGEPFYGLCAQLADTRIEAFLSELNVVE